jgi:hypothetical protein
VAEGVDPTATPWGLNGLGWFLVLLPFLVFALGFLYSSLVHKPNRALGIDEVAYN